MNSLVLFFIFSFYIIHAEHLPLVKTLYGEIQGTFSTSYKGTVFAQFLGVPYAQPPIGKLRFVEPQPLQPWSGVWNANISTKCIQINHGPEPEGGNLMGFLSTEDDVVPGNNGMKDQVAALKWIKENIKHFGGNSDSITITGLSAGAASVQYHYLSPLSRGLFNRGISVSGNALCAWTLQEAPLEKARRLGASVGCNKKTTTKLINCLRQRPAHQIVENIIMFRPWLFNLIAPFGVVVEKAGNEPFLPEDPYVMLSKGQVQDLPWLTSVTSDEGLYPAADFAVKDNFLPDLEKRWEELASSVLEYNYTLPVEIHKEVAKKIKDGYLKGKPISKGTYKEVIQMIGDRHFVVSSEKAARLQAKANKSPVYYYYFSYTGEKVLTYAIYYTLSEEKHGVCHGDDIMFILSTPTLPVNKMTKTDERMKDILLKIWTSFAKTG